MDTSPMYVYEKTPDDLVKEKKAMKEAALKGKEIPDPQTLDEFSFHGSSSSCDISDIEAIMYGGHSSRFWIYRKHMISLDYDFMKFDK